MDRATTAEHLRRVEGHVTQGEGHLSRQRAIIKTLEDHGTDSREARKLLRTFEEVQAFHVAEKDRLAKVLAAFR
jgi:hypothetical protein